MASRKILLLAGLAVAAALTLSGCSTAPAPEPTPTPPTGITLSDTFSVTPLDTQFDVTAANVAELVDASTVRFVIGGSGSCPPEVASVTENNGLVNIKLKDPFETQEACTDDYRAYGFQLKSLAYEFTSFSKLWVTDGATRTQLPFVPAGE